MRLRHIKNAESDIYKYDVVINDKSNDTINTKDIFNNDNPIELELGMGKGSFISKHAIKYPSINFIGIEKYATVVIYAIKTLENLLKENSINKKLDNLRFLCIDIKDILNFFKEKSIDKIYLNFSDPWPKKRHEERRLTSKTFLDIYRKLLKENGIIEFKTDNKDLFDYSIESLKANNYNITYITYDLHAENDANNIMTEYEAKFSRLGNKIYKLVSKPILD